jgi:hypothetical protein
MSDTRATVNEFLGRLGARDADGVAALFAETIDWYVPGSSALPWTGHRTRRAQVADFFRTMWSHFHLEQSEVKLDRLIIEGEDAAALGTCTKTHTLWGKRLACEQTMDGLSVDGMKRGDKRWQK